VTYVDFPFLFSHVSRGRAGRDGDGNGNGDCDCECCSELWNDDGLHLSEGAYEALGRHLAPFVFEILDGTSLRMDDGSPRYPSPAILVGFFVLVVRRLVASWVLWCTSHKVRNNSGHLCLSAQ